jgi:hypothetical protein
MGPLRCSLSGPQRAGGGDELPTSRGGVITSAAIAMSSTTCPVFRPTLDEFKNFSRYINYIDRHIGEYGICKVRPPTPPPGTRLGRIHR